MSYNANGVQELALINKKTLKNKFFMVPIDEEMYKFKISGLGKVTIRLEKYFYYNEILKYVSSGKKDRFEYLIGKMIADPFNQAKIPNFKSEFELKERALANKMYLKSKYIEVFIGNKEYEFRISGIGHKSVKIELFVGYDEIVKELNSSNYNSLEFILMELLLGNEVDYEMFNEAPRHKKTEERPLEDNLEINLEEIEKISQNDFESAISSVKGWSKLVFDALDDLLEDIFTLDILLNQDRILSYQTRGETLDDEVLQSLQELLDLGLVSKLNNTYYAKLW